MWKLYVVLCLWPSISIRTEQIILKSDMEDFH
jgi:hypothetical protein